MRTVYLLMLFCLLGLTSGQLIGTVAGLGASVAKLIATAVPAGLMFPLYLLGSLKLSLPMLLTLKGLGLLKLKLLLIKSPLIVPALVGVGKFKVLTAKVKLAKTAFVAAKKAKLALLELPLKVAAMKVGAVAGAAAGIKTGLAVHKSMPKTEFVHPMIIPASSFLSHPKTIQKTAYAAPEPAYGKKASPPAYTPAPPAYTPAPPAYTPAPPAYTPAPPAYTPAPPAYTPAPPAYTPAPPVYTPAPAPAYTPAPPAYTPAPAPVYTTAPPAYTPAPAPAYTPAPPAYTPAPPAYTPAPAPAYRKRRDLSDAVSTSDIHKVFEFIQGLDTDNCVARVVCELAVEPQLAPQGDDVTKLMMSLDDSDESAPWMAYRRATLAGMTTQSRRACHEKYSSCTRSTDDLIRVAQQRMEGMGEE